MSPTTTEILLRASLELNDLRRQVRDLTEANQRLRAQVNRRDFDMDADRDVSCFHVRQAE